ncbi:MAG: Rho termination factor N-terminal domain-containing protein [Thermodesulfobacteriota bacterium]
MPTVRELRERARELSVPGYGKLRKSDLIRAIQQAEGNSPCYEHIYDCRQYDCLFFHECQLRLEA